MRIRRIEKANFRKSEFTIFQEFSAKNEAFVAKLQPDDVVVFVAGSGTIMYFMHDFVSFNDNDGSEKIALQSLKHRIVGGAWNPLRLKNYAAEAGLKIEGLKYFEEHYADLVEASKKVTKRSA